MSTIAAGTTITTSLVNTGDTTGQLVLQTNGTTTAVTIGTDQNVTLQSGVINTPSSTSLVFKTNNNTTALTLSTTQTATFVGAIAAPSLSLTSTPLPAGSGGTGNAFFSVSGPASSTKTYTFPNANMSVGYLNIPQSGAAKTTSYTLTTSDIGQFIQISTGGSIIIPNSTFAAGDAIVLFNNTSGNITVTCSTSNAYIAGTDTNKTSVTLATRGLANILFYSSTACVLSGNLT